MSNKKDKIKGRVGREGEEIKQTKLMLDKAEALLEKYGTSEDIPPEELEIQKTGFDEATLLALCELIEDVLATKGVPLIGKKAYAECLDKGDTVDSKNRKVGTNPGTNQKNINRRSEEGKSRPKKIKFIRMDIIAAMVLGDPKYNN